MELSCPNRVFTLAPSLCHYSNASERPSLLRVAKVPARGRAGALKRLRLKAVASDCGAELLELEEWSEMLKWGEKCRGISTGVVELLECLEKEAIMGEDEGREAVDYNRRAQIFDKSGRVFLALKNQAEDHVEENEEENNVHSQE